MSPWPWRRDEAFVAAVSETADAAPAPNASAALSALDALGVGVVVRHGGGGALPITDIAREWWARTDMAVLRHRCDELVAAAVDTESLVEEVHLSGPPRSVFRLTRMTAEAMTVVVIEDVTAARHAEDVRADFVANISHELKTPLGALGILADALVGEDDPETVNRLAERIASESERLGAIVNDLLMLSRIESARRIDVEDIAVEALIFELEERFRDPAATRRISIDLSGVEAVLLRGDRRQVQSAVSNLLDNAIKYTPEGGQVAVSAHAIDGGVEILVNDSGVGIPLASVERIFERFYRVDRGRSRETGGTGLGLAIVNHVARNHGGRASVDSREGQGSTFTLQLFDQEGT